MTGRPRTGLQLHDLSEVDQYKLLSVAVQPRPIAWVSTLSSDGTPNLAPFSFFTVASRKPPTVLLSIGERDGVSGAEKDTLANVRATDELVINIPGQANADAVAASSTQVASEVDEHVLAGVTAVPSTVVGPPTVAEALMALECRLADEVRVGTDVLVLAEVLAVTYRSGLLDERLHVAEHAESFLGRLAGPYFTGPVTRIAQRSGIGVAPPGGQR